MFLPTQDILRWDRRGEETEISVQKATASEPSQLNKATASEPEKTDKKQKTDPASKDKINQDEISEADLYRMSDEGTLTREVLCELGAIEPTKKIDVKKYFQFTCIVDDEDDQTHTDLKQYVMDKSAYHGADPGRAGKRSAEDDLLFQWAEPYVPPRGRWKYTGLLRGDRQL